jgi:hypothetical protein
MFRILGVLLTVYCVHDSRLYAQQPDAPASGTNIIHAHQLYSGEEITLDGNLSEPIWHRIAATSDFRQREPDEGAQPTERTEIFIAYDDHYLYIAARMLDSDPSAIIAYQRRRNESLETDDRLMWILDTFKDGRNAYYFEINPAGLRGDGLIRLGQGRNLNRAWDGIWDASVKKNNEGWVAEIKIPFRTLDFNPDNLNWGINFQRTVRRKNEEILWSGWRRNQSLLRPQDAGTLTGLENISQGIGLEIQPYVSASPVRSWNLNGERRDDVDLNAGFDVSYSITPSLRSSITINTDFAEAEVDQRRVNLTRFPLIFPEQRDFFLEGSGIFQFAPASAVYPFFSRRIGLVGGEPVPVQGGARLIGRAGNTNIGFYQIRTGGNKADTEDFTVTRVVQNFLTESSLGFYYTRRANITDDALPVQQTLAADLELNTSRFLGNKNLQFQAFFVWHNENFPGEESGFLDRTSRGIRLSYPNYPFTANVSYREFGNAFNPAVGIAPRVSFRRFQPTFDYQRILPENDLLRSVNFQLRFEYLTDLDFDPETVQLKITPLDLVFESGDQISASISRDFERLKFNFDILRDGTTIILPGDYYTWSLNIIAASAGYRPLSVAGDYVYESFWTGIRSVYTSTLTVRPYPGINLSGDWSRTNADLPEGNFTADLFRFRGNVDLSPDISFTTILQFDNVSELLGLYNRFRWILRPGADLFLVHTWNWVQLDNRFSPLETQGSLKLNYTYRF